MPRVTVLVAEAHPLMRAGLRALLESDGRFVVAGECAHGRELARRCERLKPDVVLLDARLPGLDGFLGAGARAREARIVLLAHGGSAAKASGGVGAHAVLSKTEPSHRIVAAIAKVARRRRPRGPSAWLTDRERQVVALVAQGLTGPQIAARLRVALRTVHKHRENALRKLGVRGTAGLIKYAVRHGLARLSG